ncbi:MAG: DUF6282 family protein [Dehalococcoidia bacterium]
MSDITDLIHGAIDIHVHFGPDPRTERRAGPIEIARRAKELGMRGLVFKSHEYPTEPVAAVVREVVEGIELVGGVALDDEVGAVNPHAVWATARMGGRVVWMPTFNAAAYRAHQGADGGSRILDAEGKLTAATREVLALIKEHDLVLATGHVGLDEVRALWSEAKALGITRFVVTHVTTCAAWYGFSMADVKPLADEGALCEHCVLQMMPGAHSSTPAALRAAVETLGVEHCILSTDFGQWNNPIPPEGLRMGLGMLLQAGMTREDLATMVQTNPARLLW